MTVLIILSVNQPERGGVVEVDGVPDPDSLVDLQVGHPDLRIVKSCWSGGGYRHDDGGDHEYDGAVHDDGGGDHDDDCADHGGDGGWL